LFGVTVTKEYDVRCFNSSMDSTPSLQLTALLINAVRERHGI
jgi:hypothetical protein